MAFSMDLDSSQSLSRLLRGERIAFLATVLDGEPLASMVPYAAAGDLSSFHIHVNQLAPYARALMQNPHVSLMIAEAGRFQARG
jgi:hypothetical protein